MSSNHFEVLEPPTDVISAVHFAPKNQSRLLVSSWDKKVYLYQIDGPEGRLIRSYEHVGPVLDVCFGKDEREAFSAGLDFHVKRIDLESGVQTILSTHEKGAKSVAYSPSIGILVSGSWDSTLHVHFPAEPDRTPYVVKLPSKVFALSISATKLIVAMASRALYIYDLKTLAGQASDAAATPPVPWQQRESSLKFMTRALACMPNDAGYASSSIEGRVAVEWFDPGQDSQARKYAFKCHRLQGEDGVDEVYPVNALAFHPVYGTFASGGGDGIVALWDAVGKRRIRQYQRYLSSISALTFSHEGKYIAIAIGPGFEDGMESNMPEGTVKMFLRELAESEAKSKGAK